MQEQHRLSDQESEAEAALGRLRPLRPTISSGDILWELERRRGFRQLWTWRAIAACLGAGLAVSLLVRSQPPGNSSDHRSPPQIVLDRSTARAQKRPTYAIPFAADSSTMLKEDYLSKRDRIMVLGLSGLSSPPPDVSPVPLPVEPKRQPPIDEPLLTFMKPLIRGV